MQDEVKALQLCQTKIRQKKLPMEVIDAEYQWCVFIFFDGFEWSIDAYMSFFGSKFTLFRTRIYWFCVRVLLCVGIDASLRFIMWRIAGLIFVSSCVSCFGEFFFLSFFLWNGWVEYGCGHGCGYGYGYGWVTSGWFKDKGVVI